MTGSDIKNFRLALGLSQEKFGAELGLKHPQVQMSQIESGRRVISGRLEKTIEKWKMLVEASGGTK